MDEQTKQIKRAVIEMVCRSNEWLFETLDNPACRAELGIADNWRERLANWRDKELAELD